MNPNQLYYIAIIPPEPILSEIRDFKLHFAQHYNSKSALRSPGHITLHMPFQWKPEKEGLLIATLSDFVLQQQSTELILNGFGAFKPRVIFIEVEPNALLTALQLSLSKWMKLHLNVFNANYREQAYKPHITVAFRDLRPAQFNAAWMLFKEREYKTSFWASSISLLKHKQNYWEIIKEFPFPESRAI
jgi:2'-5' RNA ligase